MTKINVYSCGIELCFRIDVGPGADDTDARNRVAAYVEPASRRAHRAGLELSVTLPSGEAVALDDADDSSTEPRRRPHLSHGAVNGSGMPDHFVMNLTYWLWPLPGDGAVVIAASCPQLDLASASVAVDLARVTRAIPRVMTIGQVDG